MILYLKGKKKLHTLKCFKSHLHEGQSPEIFLPAATFPSSALKVENLPR